MNDWEKSKPTPDSLKYNKDCMDFTCLNDGTIYRECKYCDYSVECRQIDIKNGNPVPMESHYCPVADPTTHEVVEWQYYCTGLHDTRSINERKEGDDKIS